jgi:hypothetical protein
VVDEGKPQRVQGPPSGGPSRLSRRRVLAWAGGVGLAALLPGCAGDEGASDTTAAASTSTAGTTPIPDCVLTPELT